MITINVKALKALNIHYWKRCMELNCMPNNIGNIISAKYINFFNKKIKNKYLNI